MSKRDLTDRERLILREVIAQYILNAAPIGSRTLSKRLGGRFSPATIRNVMADLEELGLLYQPHTSAGRIPTEQGYRLFVDSLMELGQPTPRERKLLDREITRISSSDVRGVLEQTAQLLGDIANLLCVVMSPPLREGVLHRIDLIGIGGDKILLVITIQSGFVRSMFLEVNSPVTREEIEWLTTFLNQRLSGLKLSEVRSSVHERLAGKEARKSPVLQTMLDKAQEVFDFSEKDEYLVGGVRSLASQPEFYNVEELRKVLTLLEDKSLFLHLFARETDGIQVKIGRENAVKSLSSLSIVTAPYKFHNLTGVIGIIGPMRMNYPKAVSIVEYASRKIDTTIGD
ncbi:heat-inducible transcription repressor HrcA [candidate division LCP-89 bacterium B3_LCP]|uniref:Heat-inducible transcription repressor HrcA n=1 Tax=candidate division LCP-89 bacterium B3_LCP TaxID=2012998 RepID=A0A532V1M6_UNCL8|nr:MAG: heat-inducible transcription repressor HrcA [candidate division LCP-89 bacterium B3_LCP]